jgi:glycosyltransferase involved in cell wall biosynthesis
MAHASLFVLPSRWEGLPTVLIEALYLGARIVATDCPGGSSEILKGGKYGRLIPMDYPQALAEAIETSLGCESPCPSRESWAPYSLEFITDRYLSLLFGN